MSEYIIGERILDMGDCSLRFEQREEIVRCRDCKHYDPHYFDEWTVRMTGAYPLFCMRPDGNGDYMRFEVEPDGFCAWGERVSE